MGELVVKDSEAILWGGCKYVLAGKLRDAGAPVAPVKNHFDLYEEPDLLPGARIRWEYSPERQETRYWWEDAPKVADVSMVKVDEILLALGVLQGLSVRMVVGLSTIPPKRAWYYCDKWSDKGWYEWGVVCDLGWLTEKGKKALAERVEAWIAQEKRRGV